MNNKAKLPHRPTRPACTGVDAGQRRALARLGIVTAGTYVAPMLLALRSPQRAPDVPGRSIVAA